MSSTKSEFDDFFRTLFSGSVKPGVVPQYFEKDYDAIVENWRKVWSSKLHRETGDWCLGGFDWHVFTYNYATALSGDEALNRYSEKRNTFGYVFTHEGGTPVCCATNQLPSMVAIKYALNLFKEFADVYVVDKNFTWTFVYTHETESGIGPFFASAE